MNFQFTLGTKEQVLERIVSGVEKGRVMTVATPNLEMWALARKDEEFLQALREADIRVCDGAGLWILLRRGVTRYTGWELSMDLIREAKNRDWRVMLIGGKEGVAEKAAAVISDNYDLGLVRGIMGYKDVVGAIEEEHQKVVERINKFKPQVLLVAFGHGKQERWMRMAKSKLKGRGLVIVGVGGVLDQVVDSSLRSPRVIEKIGSNVEKLKEGDKVTVNPALSCRKCSFCGEGKYNICTNLKFLGDQLDGAFAEYIKVPVDRIIPLSSDMTFVQSALIEPTAMAVHAVNRANVKLGTKVVVIGAGPIGLLICQMAMVRGASEMIVADKRESQINLAKSLGAKHVVNVSEVHLKEKVNEITGGEGVDLVFECAGAKESIAEALKIVKNGGDVVMVSLPAKDLTLPIVQISLKEVNLVGVGVYLQREIITAINLILKRKIKVEPLVTHTFGLREIRQAFELAAGREEGVCKVIIKIGEAGL